MIDNLHNGIREVIKKFSRDLYLIHADRNIKCTCHLEGSGQPDPDCQKCLGTGFKIYIRKVHGASQTSQLPTSMRAGTNAYIAMNFYFIDNLPIEQDDIVIKDGEPFVVYQLTRQTGFAGRYCYVKVCCTEKKIESKVFMSNFNKLVSK